MPERKKSKSGKKQTEEWLTTGTSSRSMAAVTFSSSLSNPFLSFRVISESQLSSLSLKRIFWTAKICFQDQGCKWRSVFKTFYVCYPLLHNYLFCWGFFSLLCFLRGEGANANGEGSTLNIYFAQHFGNSKSGLHSAVNFALLWAGLRIHSEVTRHVQQHTAVWKKLLEV